MNGCYFHSFVEAYFRLRTTFFPNYASSCANRTMCYTDAHMKIAKRTYTLSIEEHPDGHLAFFPALPGCHTWGESYEQAIKNAEEALALYLKSLAAHGDPIPEDTDNNFPVSLGVTVRTTTVA
jgi:antitoxin HicB